MKYKIVRAGTLSALEMLVDVTAVDGWDAAGGPVHDRDGREWAQAMVKRAPAERNGEVRLREPKARLR